MIEYLYTLNYEVERHAFSSDDCIIKPNALTEVAKFSELSVTSDRVSLPDEVKSTVPPADVTKPFGPLKPSVDQAPEYDTLSFHILMYSLADRLFIEGLKALSKENVEHELVQRLDASSFSEAISEIYRSTPIHDRGLRDLAIKTTMNHLTTLRNSNETAF